MGKIEEMLASGRAPMVFSRGGQRSTETKVAAPLCASPGALERRAKGVAKVLRRYRDDARAAAAARRTSVSARGEMRRIGSVPVEKFIEMHQTMGAQALTDTNEVRQELDRSGFLFEK
jgi:hypothetical protein